MCQQEFNDIFSALGKKNRLWLIVKLKKTDLSKYSFISN